MEKLIYLDNSIKKVKLIYYIDSLHTVKYFKVLFLLILVIMAYI